MKQCIIVIPLYKEHPETSELASFRQCLTILKQHDICVVTHENLNLAEYYAVSENIGKSLDIQYFHQDYFKSVQGYNALCLSCSFYERFMDHEYMLIYQTDAWVFRDELTYWCDKGYDFLGAPWFCYRNTKTQIFSDKPLGAGNGGFNLRRISYCLDVLNSNPDQKLLRPMFLLKQYRNFFVLMDKDFKWWLTALRVPVAFIAKCFGIKNRLKDAIKKDNEDTIFSLYAENSYKFQPKLPTREEAIQFAFEVHPSMLYKQNGGKLPFGCHAFEKYEFESFWNKYITI